MQGDKLALLKANNLLSNNNCLFSSSLSFLLIQIISSYLFPFLPLLPQHPLLPYLRDIPLWEVLYPPTTNL